MLNNDRNNEIDFFIQKSCQLMQHLREKNAQETIKIRFVKSQYLSLE